MTDELPPWDALHLEIGRVAQVHVRLDASLRSVYVQLASPSLAIYLVNDMTSTSALVNACRTMLRNADIPEVVRQAGLSALDSAALANTERNRVVHDRWLPDFTGDVARPDRWNISRNSRGSFGATAVGMRDLQSVVDARVQIIRSEIRISTLHWALSSTLPFFRNSGMPESWPIEHQIAVMEDHFDIDENGGFRPHVEGQAGESGTERESGDTEAEAGQG